MELTQLKFVVDTSDLKNASAAIKQLADDVSKLNKPMQEATKASSNLNKEQQKSSATSKQTESSVKKQTSVLERQQMILEFMTQGFSKGQSSQLAYAKAAGAVTDEIEQLGKVLQTQRTLMGTDPFDKSLGAMQALKNEYTVIKEVQRLYNAELGLSKTQMEDLAREKLRLIEKFKLEGASLSQIKQGLKDLNVAYISNASAENSITSSIKARQKAIQDTAKAQNYVAAEFERVNRLTSENGNITSATNNKIIAMEKALRMSGMSAEQQVAKLNAYKKSLAEIQGAAGQRQVDYLSRALGPQITDIFVGLATGQSPMMVLLQQGGQLRDQFALAGVAGKNMADMLVQASKAMLVSIKDIGVAIGELLLKSIVGVGSAIGSSLIAPFKQLSLGIVGLASGTMTATEALNGLKVAFMGLAKTGLLTIVAGLAALAYEYVQVTKATTNLSQAIALTGASLGMSRDQAVSFAEALSQKTGTSTLKYIGILTEFAKAGATVNEEVVALANDMDKYLGQSVDKTAQQFAEFGNEPTKALIKIAKEQGFVSEATLRQVYALEEAGKKTEAAKVAQEAYLASQNNAVAQAKANLDPLQKLWLDIKSAVSQASEAVYDLLKSGPVVAVFRTAWETVAVIASEVWYVLKATGKEIGGIGSQIAAVMRGDFAGAAKIGEQMKADAEVARKAQDELVASILNRNEAESKGSAISAEQALANSNNAKSFEDRMKLQKESLDYFNGIMKEAARIQNEAAFAGYELNAAQKKMIEIIADPKFAKLPQDKQSQALATLAAASAVIEETKALEELRKQNAKVTEEYIKQQAAKDKLWFDSMEASDAATKAVRLETGALDFQTQILSKTERERTRAIKLRQVELELAKENEQIDKKIGLDAAQREELKAEAAARAAQKIANVNKSINYEDEKARVDAYGNAFKNVFNGMADAIVEFAKTGKLSFSGLIDTMIADLLRFEMRKQMMSMYEGFGGSAGIIGGIKSMFGFADGGAFNGGVQAFAKGGTFTNSIVDSPTLFKFAKGTGLMGEAGPEAIMPLARDSSGRLGVQASGSSSNVSVQVINNTNAQATTNETTDSNGNRRIEVVIGDMTAGEISRSGSASQKSIRSTFGIQPQLIRR